MGNKPPAYVPYHRGGQRFNLTLQTDALVQKYALVACTLPPAPHAWVEIHH